MTTRPLFTDAAILVNLKEELIVDKIELPRELKPGQVLIQVLVSGICGSQIGEIDGVKGVDKFLPHLLGHEGCGIVLEIGPGVSTLKKGDKVVLHWKKGLGINSETPTYKWRGSKLNAGWVTTFNKHAVISENRCTKINNEIKNDHSALFGCAVTTGFGVIENNAKLKIGESIIVFGAGGIGLNIIQAAKLVSAYPIIAVDLYGERLELALKFGATHIINTSQQEFIEEIQKITNSIDVFVDNTGIPSIIEMGYDLINTEGRLILVGVPNKGANINIFSLPLHFGKKIQGSFGGECQPNKDIPRYINLLQKGKWSLDGLVTERHSLQDINAAISNMKNGKSIGRVLIDM